MDIPKWSTILEDAVKKPGLIMEAYSRFHNYSVGNQIAIMSQCFAREINPGPIATFNRWKELNRSVKRGEKAFFLCQPVTMKDKRAKEGEEKLFTLFTWKPRWFVLAQTEGADYVEPTVNLNWDKAKALISLQIEETQFVDTNGNTQGYAIERKIAINPVAQMPHKTLFHEIAHVMLGHTTKGSQSDTHSLPRNLKEVEAESVALICLESLNLPGSEYCRGYIQNWIDDSEIPESSAQSIFKAADNILKAGTDNANG